MCLHRNTTNNKSSHDDDSVIVLAEWNCALMHITDGDTDQHLQLIDDGLIKQLIADKWKTFARVYTGQFTTLILQMAVWLSIAGRVKEVTLCRASLV